MNYCPVWYHDPNDEVRYPVALDNVCPADGTTLYRAEGSDVCVRCFRVFEKDGRRMARVWWSGSMHRVTADDLGQMIMELLRSARPHPVEHPTMWRVWGEVCKRVGLNPDDYRVPRSE